MAGAQRLDAWLRRARPAWGRQAVQRLIAGRQVRVNGRVVWLASWQVANGDVVFIEQPPPDQASAPDATPGAVGDGAPRFDDAWVLYLDDELVVVNKPAGLLPEAPPYRPDAPNLHGLAQARFGPLTLFHRLDRDTSGVLVLSRSAAANRRLAAAWQGRSVEKEYVAVVHHPNRLGAEGVIALRLGPDPSHRERRVVVTKGGQSALTRYRVERSAGLGAPVAAPNDATPGRQWVRQWVRLWPATGRTHQLRVHLAALGAPILGDRLYGEAATAARLLLHAERLALPAWEDQPAREFVAPLPEEFAWPPGAVP